VSSRRALFLFLFALAVRLAYQAALSVSGGTNIDVDSAKYIGFAGNIMEGGNMAGADAPGPHSKHMPLYPYFLALVFSLSGGTNLGAAVSFQAIVDSVTVLAVAYLAAAIDRRWALPAGILAALWPNLIISGAYILTDTLFMGFFSWGLAACLWASRKQKPAAWLFASGVGFGLALLTRPVLMYFPVFLLPALAWFLKSSMPTDWPKAVRMAALPVIVMVAFVGPRMVETYRHYGTPVVSTQAAWHVANYVYPCLRTPWTCGDLHALHAENRTLHSARLAALPPEAAANPVIADRLWRDLAIERISTLPLTQIAYGALAGVTLNLFHTSISQLGYQFKLRRSSVLAGIMSPGATFSERIASLRHAATTEWFTLAWLAGLMVLGISRLIQLGGLVSGLCQKDMRGPILFLLFVALYFLVVNGPIGYARYRLPMEPTLIVLLVAGLAGLGLLDRIEGAMKRMRRRRNRENGPMGKKPTISLRCS
jgi:4-amino-4-deoxy-L-arabinose transferase-like glycosyltransferase